MSNLPVDASPLRIPTDIGILEAIKDGDRYTPKLVSLIIGKDPSYVSSELSGLSARGYTKDPIREYEDISNEERSGMYQLTDIGKIVTAHIDRYVRSYHEAFDKTARRILRNQPDNELVVDLIVLGDDEIKVLRELSNGDMIIPSEVESATDRDPGSVLFTLNFYGLVERLEEMDVYRIAPRGQDVLSMVNDGVTDPINLTCEARKQYSEEEKRRLKEITDMDLSI